MTRLATVRFLEAKAVDDALELFDVLITNELLGRAERESSREKLRRYPRISRDAGKLAAAVEVFLEAREWGADVSLESVWDAIENVVPRAELRAAVDVVSAGWWRGFVFTPCRPEGTVHKAAYVFCVLEQLHQRLKRRDIFATASARWNDPRARLLTGTAWEQAKGSALNAL